MSKTFILSAAFTGLVVLSGCGSAPEEVATALPETPRQLTPYQTATQTVSQVLATEPSTPTPPPLPSPTPFLYVVVQNDTMIGIAARFGVTLDELQAANPGVNPNVLSIGTELVIPVSFEGEEETAEQVLALTEGAVECTPGRSGGMWCIWLVSNPLAQPVENIAGIVRLFDRSGEQAASQPAVPMVNVLEPNQQTPLAAFFPPPLPDWQLAQGQLLSAVAASQFEQRYLSGTLEDLAVNISQDGLQAEVSGLLSLDDDLVPEYIWVAAVAYDDQGAVAGFRRWEVPSDQLSASAQFIFQVYSLARPITQVEVFFEARSGEPADNGS